MSIVTEARCAKHPSRQVMGTCGKCRKPLCELCVRPGDVRQICKSCLRPRQIAKVGLIVALISIPLVGTISAYRYFKSANTPVYKKSSLAGGNRSNHPANQSGFQREEPCDRIKVLERCNALIGENNPRSCLLLSDRFFEQCGDYDQLHRYRNAAARRLSEWNIALSSADKLVETYPDNADMRWMRGGTYEEQGDLPAAVKDYEQSLALMPRAIQPPFHLANLYQRLGDPCAGISPLEQFSFYYPDRSENADRLLQKFYRDPKCAAMQGSGTAKIRISAAGRAIKSKAKINGAHTGTFLIDTGASTVVFSRTFADRLNLPYRDWPTRLTQTANGPAEGYYGYVDQVAVQGVAAKHIEAFVANDIGDIDGLLGLSFLGRFKIEMDPEKGYIALTQKTR